MQRMIIRGSEWHRGGKSQMGCESLLLTDGGFRCCIGIHARVCGIPDEFIAGVGQPESMDPEHVVECYLPWIRSGEQNMRTEESDIAGDAMDINDAPDTDDAEKITALRPIFAEIGVSIVWRPDL